MVRTSRSLRSHSVRVHKRARSETSTARAQAPSCLGSLHWLNLVLPQGNVSHCFSHTAKLRWWLVIIAQQQLAIDDIMPAAKLPSHTAKRADATKAERLMKSFA